MSVTERWFDEAKIDEAIHRSNTTRRPLYLLIIGTRPCYTKLAELVYELQRKKESIPHLVFESGQHYEAHLIGPREELGYADRIAGCLHTRGTLVHRVTESVPGLEALWGRLRSGGIKEPVIPVISGDTTTAAIVPLLWYFLTGYTSVHIEAGLRSEGPDWPKVGLEVLASQRQAVWHCRDHEPYPEGFCTRLASTAAGLFFAPVERNRRHLLREGKSAERIHLSGSLSADAVRLGLKTASLAPLLAAHPELATGRWLRVDIHRRENMTRSRLIALLDGLGDFAAETARVVLVDSGALARARDQLGLDAHVRQAQKRGVLLTQAWPTYGSVLAFLRSPGCGLLYTDSGGLQEEAHILGVPCVTARASTDRPETVLEAQTNLLAPLLSGPFVRSALTRAWAETEKRETPRTVLNGDLYGTAVARKIASVLERYEPDVANNGDIDR